MVGLRRGNLMNCVYPPRGGVYHYYCRQRCSDSKGNSITPEYDFYILADGITMLIPACSAKEILKEDFYNYLIGLCKENLNE